MTPILMMVKNKSDFINGTNNQIKKKVDVRVYQFTILVMGMSNNSAGIIHGFNKKGMQKKDARMNPDAPTIHYGVQPI